MGLAPYAERPLVWGKDVGSNPAGGSSVPAEVCDDMVKKILDFTGPRASKYDGDKLPPSLSFLYVTQGVAC